MTSCLLHCTLIPSEMSLTLKGKNLLQLEANSFLIQGTNNFESCLSTESFSIPLKGSEYTSKGDHSVVSGKHNYFNYFLLPLNKEAKTLA